MSKQIDYIYGIHPVQAALENEAQQINQLFVLNNRQDKPLQLILAEAKKAGIRTQFLTRHELDTLVGHSHHQGIIAAIRAKVLFSEEDLPALLEESSTKPLLLILDEIQDPHNLGACLRSANAAGVTAVITTKDKAVGLTPVVRKVACGAAEATPFIQVTNLARTLRELKEQGVWLFGMAGEAKKSIYQADLTGPVGILMGSEGSGLRQLTRQQCDELLYIPMAGTVNSLNVSVATGISLFEVQRQRLKS
jgi:23S rRNA (guanosine2251-2'-O)-methyltransferase